MQAKRKSIQASAKKQASRRQQSTATKRGGTSSARPRTKTASTGKRTRTSASAKTARPQATDKRRKSVAAKAARGKQTTRSPKRTTQQKERSPRSKVLLRVGCLAALVAIVIVCAGAAFIFQNENNKYASAEQYRATVSSACFDSDLDPAWTDSILAAMIVESGGNKNVDSVLGVENDIMQAAEGAYGWIVKDGWPEKNIQAQTTTASIYAGVLEFKQNLKLWEDYLGPIGSENTTGIQLVIQGYNFGADGWHAWCKARGIKEYTVELAEEYSDTRMPEGLKGTPTHAQKWLNVYNKIHGKK